MLTLKQLFAGCPNLTTAQKWNLLRGPGHLETNAAGADPEIRVSYGPVLVLWLADMLVYDKALPDFDTVHLLLTDFAVDIAAAAEELQQAMEAKLAPVPVYRLTLIDKAYASWTSEERRQPFALDLATGLRRGPPHADLKTESYNVTSLFVRRLRATKTEIHRDDNPTSPLS